MIRLGASLEEIIGDAQRIDAGLQRFRKDTKVLSSRRANLIGRYPKKWIAVFDGEVRASGPSLNTVLAAVDELGLPRESVVIRYVDKNLRRMVL